LYGCQCTTISFIYYCVGWRLAIIFISYPLLYISIIRCKSCRHSVTFSSKARVSSRTLYRKILSPMGAEISRKRNVRGAMDLSITNRKSVKLSVSGRSITEYIWKESYESYESYDYRKASTKNRSRQQHQHPLRFVAELNNIISTSTECHFGIYQ